MAFINNTTSYLWLIIVIGLILYYVTFLYQNWKYIKFAWNAKGFFVPIIPFVGSSYVILLAGFKINPISFFDWLNDNIGFPLNFWYGHNYNYISTDADEVKIILNHPKCYNKALIYENVQCLFRDALALVAYDKWKPRRKHFSRAFSPNIFKANLPTIYRQSCELIEELKSLKGNESIFECLTRYTYTNFFLATMGLDEDKKFYDMGRFAAAAAEIQDLFQQALLNPVIPTNLWLKWFPSGRTANKLLHEVNSITKKVIRMKKEQHEDMQAYVDSTSQVCLMDLMLTGILKDEEVYEELKLFSSASTDTSAFTMAHCFTLLGMNPEIQEKLYKEVIDVIGEYEITYEDLPQLKYTEAVINETLRLFPVLPILGRKCDVDIDLGSKILPAGSSFLVSVFHMQRNPKYWKDPLKFDPSRFMPENQSQIRPCSFIPFSFGQRDCIGKTYAMVVLKTTIANVIRNFKIASNHQSIKEFCLESCVSMRTTSHLDCRFTPRFSR